MTSENSSRFAKWRITFLGAIGLGIGMEFWALFDGSDNTEPLTTIILKFIPAYLFFPAISAFFVWVIWHFGKYYSEILRAKSSSKVNK